MYALAVYGRTYYHVTCSTFHSKMLWRTLEWYKLSMLSFKIVYFQIQDCSVKCQLIHLNILSNSLQGNAHSQVFKKGLYLKSHGLKFLKGLSFFSCELSCEVSINPSENLVKFLAGKAYSQVFKRAFNLKSHELKFLKGHSFSAEWTVMCCFK